MRFNQWTPRQGYLPCLSVQQPYAFLLAHALKDVENRDWKTDYRGPLLIHAGKKIDTDVLPRPHVNHQYYLNKKHWHDVVYQMPKSEREYETGGIVGICQLADVVTSSNSPWFVGRYGFVLRDARPLPYTPYKGALGLFAVSESVLTAQGLEDVLSAVQQPQTSAGEPYCEGEHVSFRWNKRRWNGTITKVYGPLDDRQVSITVLATDLGGKQHSSEITMPMKKFIEAAK